MDYVPEAIFLYGVIFFVVVGLSLGAYLLLRAPRLTPEEVERRRRLHLNRIGRVTEARIIEILGDEASNDTGCDNVNINNTGDDDSEEAPNTIHMLSYCYTIRGVEYETVQDVRFRQQQIDLSRVAAGQPASVKYDRQNPANSILLCEDWSGL